MRTSEPRSNGPVASPQPDRIPDRRHFDAIVVGAGSGGLTAAVGLGRFGRQVLLVEKEHMGGECTNTGCIPSKSLLHQTASLQSDPDHAARDADQKLSDTRLEGQPSDILDRVRQRRDGLREHEVEVFGGAEGITFVYGAARLRSATDVEIVARDGEIWTASADNLILSTGSAPRRIPIEGLPDECYLTNEELFELSAVPSHLVVVGGGAVGLEMAVAFRRLGARVTVVEAMDNVLPGLLPEAVELITSALEADGIEVRTSETVQRYDPSIDALVTEHFGTDSADKARPEPITGPAKVLVAVGRTPNTTDLGLAEVGVEVDDRRAVIVDHRGRTSLAGVWAVGDMTTKGGTTHFAMVWGRRIIQSIVYPYVPVGAEPLRPTVTFTNPEVATIGLQPPTPPDDVLRITVDGSSIDRAYTDHADRGLLVVDVRPPTGEVLGATVVSPRAGEIVTTFSLAMKTGIAFHRWYGTVVPYPTYGEVITEAVEQYLSETAAGFGGHVGRWFGGLGRRSIDRLKSFARRSRATDR